MRALTLPIAAAIAAVVASAAAARADGLVELAAGGAIPLAEDDYTDAVDNSVKFALHAASVGERGVGVDLGLDVTPVSLETSQFFGLEASAWRFRGLVGARGQWPLGAQAVGFVRGGAGVDVARYAVSVRCSASRSTTARPTSASRSRSAAASACAWVACC
jgi:hypothetical protein